MKKDGIFDTPARGKIRLGDGAEGEGRGYGQGAAGNSGKSPPVFDYRCKWSPKGKVIEKIEIGPLGRNVFTYEYDAAGHLTLVRRNEELSEYYSYDDSGLRIQDFRSWAAERRNLTYYYTGALVQAGNVHLKWSDAGQLLSMEQVTEQERWHMAFQYGHDTRLDRVVLEDGTEVRYHYGNELLPVKITMNGATVFEYQWQNTLRLARCRDAWFGLNYDFAYGDGRAPLRVQISGSRDAMHQATGLYAGQATLDIFVDQVDSVRELALPDGRPVKCLEYDSFGGVALDTRPGWIFPLGFACGLNDPWTGFVRFGFRDYDSRFGRFTAKDPLGYTGGDYDLYDYCVDDPVGNIDPTGLFLFGCAPRNLNNGGQVPPAPPVPATPAPPQMHTAHARQPAQAAPGPQEPPMAVAHRERHWLYNQRTGQLRDPDGNLDSVRGYSGRPDEYRNNPAMEGVRDKGPIPAGMWRIDDAVPQDRPKTGAYSIRIYPDGHDARGRTMFFIHGDSKEHPGDASEGCPIFTRQQRERIYGSGVRRFRVVDEPEWPQGAR